MSWSSLHDGMLSREIVVFDAFTGTEKSTVAKCACLIYYCYSCDNCQRVLSLLLLLNKKFFLHFRFLRNLPTILFLYESIFLLLCYSCVFLRYLSGCFFVAMKFLVTNMRFFQTFLDFCKPEFLLNIIMFAKIATKICKESFATACNPD